jgi:hypothetical protein
MTTPATKFPMADVTWKPMLDGEQWAYVRSGEMFSRGFIREERAADAPGLAWLATSVADEMVSTWHGTPEAARAALGERLLATLASRLAAVSSPSVALAPAPVCSEERRCDARFTNDGACISPTAITGQVGFDAYGSAGPNPWKTFNGGDMPRWSALGETPTGLVTRERWAAAARAEIDAFLAGHGLEIVPADVFANTPERLAPIAKGPAITTTSNRG